MSQSFDSFEQDQQDFGDWQVEQETSSQGGGCLKGCLIIVAVLVLLAMVSSWFVVQNWRGWAGTLVRNTLEQTLNETELPEEEKQQIQQQVDRVVVAFEEGQLTEEQVNTLLEEVAGSPLAAAVVAFSIEKKYFDDSDLTAEEKDQGRTTLRRCVRGWMDDDLTEEDINAVLSHIGTRQQDGNWELHDTVTNEELRAFLADAKERADNAGVAETVQEVDPSDEIKRIVDTVLNPATVENEMQDSVDSTNDQPAQTEDSESSTDQQLNVPANLPESETTSPDADEAKEAQPDSVPEPKEPSETVES